MDIGPPAGTDAAPIAALLDVVARDGAEALSEFKQSRVLSGTGVCEAVGRRDAEVVCYVQAAWHAAVVEGGRGHWALEIASRADEARTADVVRFVTSRLDTTERWVLWTRRSLDSGVAGRLGLITTRSLHRRVVGLPVDHPGPPPEGITVTGFRPGVDEDDWIDTNNAAFAGHPENGAVDHAEFAHRVAHGWFDADGLRMAWAGGRLAGSCWTKVHPDGEGEIHIIGVHPDHQGRGLGRYLVLEGLRYLAEERGSAIGSLWVDAESRAAMALYDELGFVTVQTIEQRELR